uniref:Phage tail assembly protein n=1 Tax=Thermosporothrix sp. COM3 TaxID=2490863 RepID=A0A455SR87_9CHLR|nr:hypothetical protein KTC_48870 [Thermosporothrix sp. COM3]BBH90201.1 hypothetical protein KTC_49520 [Thermosporothrix sp. COM3]BBH90266.1 hypothetical protein KTC_50170 [Thermosporothrix sp. COM3]
MKPAEIRAKFFNRRLKVQDLEVTLPGLEELDGQLALRELTAKEVVQAERLSKDETGRNEALEAAAFVTYSLITREGKEQIFSEQDIDGVAGFGMSVLTPIAEKIRELSAIDADETQKNLKQTTSNTSPTS